MAAETENRLRFVGRQAILDNKMHTYGHELLFRSGMDNYFSGEENHATNYVIDCCLSMIACSSSPNLFINCTRDSLLSGIVKLLPSRTVVLEILETVVPDADVVKACKQLKRSGFRLSLDDFSPEESKRELVEIADFIKVDFISSTSAMRQEIYSMCRKKSISFIAEKVETISDVTSVRLQVEQIQLVANIA
jgi:c-di-GMP-related signal transduction protein